ncbi:hypothetical protein PAAG_05905 [Paracoccidioides lutzii Pb01]|uniref:DsDNA-binding protein PDCD5 n=1 Tax=Paracoccidioides lutzii (strain ATCC MYA-826 / Pb01) TaxID=502779 RepID=C1H564_PARBA|nr:hypothetical protein PAAG_05905 [Paracoccidioides lutzii Pb01]EEH34858.2 hypothetical protein PAAG_05905 [Paracoccidioides lutzii Pb01]
MADAELEEIRKVRLAQLQAQAGSSSGSGEGASREQKQVIVYGTAGSKKVVKYPQYPAPGFLTPPFDCDDLVQQATSNTDARQAILSQILLPEAADRLGRIRLVKEERATDIENRLIMLARTGQLRSKVTEEQLKELLNAVAENKEQEKIVISRRKGGWDDDDDLLDL